MSQDYSDNPFDSQHDAQTDLQNMENNFASLKTIFSGASQPGSMGATTPWFDTTQHVLKVRNDGDTAWIGLMHGDANQKMWVYRNAAMDGWAIDSGVSDKVLSLKGGSTYTAGGAAAGTWTISGFASGAHTHGPGTLSGGNHNHMWYRYKGDNDEDDKTYDVDGNQLDFAIWGGVVKLNNYYVMRAHEASPGYAQGHGKHLYTDNETVSIDTGVTASDGGTPTQDGTWRPAAAVGTLQYLDL